MKKLIKKNRSAITGRYVTARYAEKNKKTTVTEASRSKKPNKR